MIGDVVGIIVDTTDGKLSFSRNGEDMGVAYTNEEIKKGEWYASIAVLYNDDCLALE